MPNRYSWLTGLLLAASTAAAQAQAPVLHPVQTITLSPNAWLSSTLLLPNHNTVLLLCDLSSPTLIAQCLAPDGHTLWKTPLICYETTYSVFTKGNEIVMQELIGADIVKSQRKANGAELHEGQTLVQSLDEQGHLTQHMFELPPLPEGKKKAPDYLVMGRYADADGYAEIVQETGGRLQKYQSREHQPDQGPIIRHYNLKTKQIISQPLVLPTVPRSSLAYQLWYTDWAYLGHYQDHLYFCRRSLAGDTEKQPGKGPLLYHVYITDERGLAASPGGFTTPVDLTPTGTRVAYSGRLYNNGDMSHIPRTMLISSGHTGGGAKAEFDSWDMTTGGMGSFYLDYATGDVLLYGEYTDEALDQFNRDNIQGLFFRRFSPDGKLLAQSQTAYSADMLKDKEKLSFKVNIDRHFSMHADPLNGQYHLTISPTDHWGNIESFNLFIDHDLRWQRYDHSRREDKNKDKRLFTTVCYTQPYEYYNSFTRSTAYIYERPQPTDPPVYAALEQLRRPDGPAYVADPTNFQYVPPSHLFYLSATGAGIGLIVERMQRRGGPLKVYTF